MFSKEKFLSFYQGQYNEKAASNCYDAIEKALIESGIYSDLVLLGALATCRIEVGRDFLPIKEWGTGLQYEFRQDLGNTVFGDGMKYKGRGFIQLTGKANYTKYGQELGIDLLNKPDLALEPTTAAQILAHYFKHTCCQTACREKNWHLVRFKVNGDYNGIYEFLDIIEQYISKLTIIMKKRGTTLIRRGD